MLLVLVLRGERDGRFGGRTHERAVKRKAPKTTTQTRSPVKTRRVRKRMTATKTTRLSGAERGGIATEKDEARTRQHPQTTTYLQMTTPANIVVFQITLSWWVPTCISHEETPSDVLFRSNPKDIQFKYIRCKTQTNKSTYWWRWNQAKFGFFVND